MVEDKTYRIDKVTRILMLYHKLINGHRVSKDLFCMDTGVSGRGFDRDIQDIRLFMSEEYFGTDVLYDKTDSAYYIPGERPQYTDKFVIIVAAKLLLSSGAFRRDEMLHLVSKLVQSASPSDRQSILRCLDNIDNYSENHDKAIFKLIRDLYTVIDRGNDILITCISNKEQTELAASPIGITYDKECFMLVCAENYRIEQIRSIRIDRIINFTILKTFYAKDIKNKYKEEGKNEQTGQISAGNGGGSAGKEHRGFKAEF